tara:strand:+ start:455 stop:667 length:213 start_codon:yes stop_codon:yes gene_type:complete
MSDLNRLNNAKITEEYDDYSEMSTEELVKLEQKMSDEYYKMDVEYCNTGQTFSLSDYTEIIRELTIRENK